MHYNTNKEANSKKGVDQVLPQDAQLWRKYYYNFYTQIHTLKNGSRTQGDNCSMR